MPHDQGGQVADATTGMMLGRQGNVLVEDEEGIAARSYCT
jgi:hypothetical protein